MSNAAQRRRRTKQIKLWVEGTLPVLMVRARLAGMPARTLEFYRGLTPEFQYRQQKSFRRDLEVAESMQGMVKIW